MPDVVYDLKKISQLPAASALSDADLIPIVQAGVTKKATKAQVGASIIAAAAASQAIVVDVSGSDSIELPAATYIQAIIITGSTGPVNVGTTDNGGELVDDTVSTGVPLVYSLLPDPFFLGAQTIYFNGTFKVRLCVWLIGE